MKFYDLNFTGVVERKSKVTTATTRYGQTQLCEAYLICDDGQYYNLTIWGDDAELIRDGGKISLTNACLEDFKGKKTISTLRKTRVTILE